MHENKPYLIRNITPDEVERIAVEWAAKEGWNPGRYDARMYTKSQPDIDLNRIYGVTTFELG